MLRLVDLFDVNVCIVDFDARVEQAGGHVGVVGFDGAGISTVARAEVVVFHHVAFLAAEEFLSNADLVRVVEDFGTVHRREFVDRDRVVRPVLLAVEDD